MNRVKLSVIIITIVLATVSISGCFEPTHMYIEYVAYYDTPLELGVIKKAISEANISLEYSDNDTLSFTYGRGFNNATVEPTYGILDTYFSGINYNASLNIELHWSEYPRPHWTEDYEEVFEDRKPLLEESMNYITGLIFNATGLTPAHKEFITGDGSQID